MSEYFLGEIRAFGFNWPPKGWAQCDGGTLGITQNQALFALLGTTFGGNGSTTFNLPDLRSRAPVHAGGDNTIQGKSGGAETVVLDSTTAPAHTHTLKASTLTATALSAAANVLAVAKPGLVSKNIYPIYGSTPTNATLAAGTISMAGSGQPHPNIQPFAVVNYCIALQGLFPSRS